MLSEMNTLLKVLADANRLRILKLLETQNMCVCEIAYILGISQPAVSKHLRRLRDAGLVSCKKTSFWTDYILKRGKGMEKGFIEFVLSQLDADKIVHDDKGQLRHIDRAKLCECK